MNQELIFVDSGKVFDKLKIKLENGIVETFFFNIDSFFGKEYQ